MSGSFGERAVQHFRASALLLGWRPRDFWTATPAELAAALTPTCAAHDAPNRGEIERLRARFPDEDGR